MGFKASDEFLNDLSESVILQLGKTTPHSACRTQRGFAVVSPTAGLSSLMLGLLKLNELEMPLIPQQVEMAVRE